MGWTIYDAEGRPLIVQQDHDEAHVLATTGPHIGTLPWADLDFTGSSLADLITRTHASLSDSPANAHHTKYTDAEVDAIVLTHKNLVAAHHAKYLDSEVDAIVATHAAIVAAHHDKYLDSEVDAIVATHAAVVAAHHDKYTDAEVDAIVATHAAIQQDGTINYVIDGGGSEITTGVKGFIVVDFAATIASVTMLADQSGSIIVDVWMDTYGNYPPTDADSITSSAVPTISGAIKSQDTTLTGWTTAIPAGRILGFNVDSVTTITRLTLSLKISRD